MGVDRPRRRSGDPRALHRRADWSADGPRDPRRLRREALAAGGARGPRDRDHRAAARRQRGRRPGHGPRPRSSCRRVRATRRAWTPRSPPSVRWRAGRSRAVRRSSASASATSCWRWRPARRRIGSPVGHHGGNHAVLEASSGRVDIGAHNHEVAVVDGPMLAAAGYAVSHRDLNDGTVEGLVHRERADRIGPVPSGGRAWTDRRGARLRPGPGARAGMTMPRKVLVIGSGPILIGQAAEFDYAGVQACLALARRGRRDGPGQLESGDRDDRSGRRRNRAHRSADARRT